MELVTVKTLIMFCPIRIWNCLLYNMNGLDHFLCGISVATGLEIIFKTHSSCGASGLNFLLVLTPVALVLK